MKKFEIGDGERISYVIKRKKTPDVNLRFKPDLVLELIIPKSWSGDLKEILERKRQWIEGRYCELLRARRIVSDNEVMYKGVPYDLRFGNNTSESVILDKGDKILTVYAKDNPMIFLRKWMKEKTRDYVLRKVKEYSETLDVEPNKVFVRDMKKWGSSSRKENLNFNWQLIGLPESLSEYVVLHEMVHLKHRGHSIPFRSEIESVCLNYKDRERKLEDYLPIPL